MTPDPQAREQLGSVKCAHCGCHLLTTHRGFVWLADRTKKFCSSHCLLAYQPQEPSDAQ